MEYKNNRFYYRSILYISYEKKRFCLKLQFLYFFIQFIFKTINKNTN